MESFLFLISIVYFVMYGFLTSVLIFLKYYIFLVWFFKKKVFLIMTFVFIRGNMKLIDCNMLEIMRMKLFTIFKWGDILIVEYY